jgi:hypothetical protein
MIGAPYSLKGTIKENIPSDSMVSGKPEAKLEKVP